MPARASPKAAKSHFFRPLPAAEERAMTVRVQTEDFDLSTEVGALRARTPKVGAVACFIGTVRDLNEGSTVETMELEHYPGMTEKSLETIVVAARGRWPGPDGLVIHRVGQAVPHGAILLG